MKSLANDDDDDVAVTMMTMLGNSLAISRLRRCDDVLPYGGGRDRHATPLGRR